MIGGVDKAEFCGDLPDIGKVRGLNSCIGYCTTRRNICSQVFFFKIDITSWKVNKKNSLHCSS